MQQSAIHSLHSWTLHYMNKKTHKLSQFCGKRDSAQDSRCFFAILPPPGPMREHFTRTVLRHEVAVVAGNCYFHEHILFPYPGPLGLHTRVSKRLRAKIPPRLLRHLHDVIIRLSFFLLRVSSTRAHSALVKPDSSARSE